MRIACRQRTCSCACSGWLSVAVKGEEDKTITAGSVVTVTVELHREPLIDVSFGDNDINDDVIAEEPDEKITELEDEEPAAQVNSTARRLHGLSTASN